jgi:hypothetical protein
MCHKTGKMIILIVNYIYIHIFTLKWLTKTRSAQGVVKY